MKNLIKIITITILIMFFNLSVYAEQKLSMALDKTDIKINENFVVSIDVETTFSWDLEISNIKWLEQFITLWQENSNQVSIINWEKSSKYTLKISLQPTKSWDFEIWPAELKIWDEVINSNTVKLKVSSEKIIVPDNEDDEESVSNENNNKNINKWNWNNQNLNNDIRWSKGSVEDIFHEFMYYQVFIILLLILVFLYTQKINKKNKIIKDFETGEIDKMIDRKHLLIKNIKKLLKNAELLNKTDFYQELNKLFREYFDILWYQNTDIMTLKEIKELNLDVNLIKMFEKSYLNEFNDKEEPLIARQDLINDLLKIIK